MTEKINNNKEDLFVNKKIYGTRFIAYLELSILFSKNFFKSFPGPFFSFGLPLFFLILFYFTIGINNKTTFDVVHGHDIIGGYILLSSVSAGFNFLSGRICEWKESVFLKRLDVTPLKKWEFMFVIICFYSCICILGTIWMFIWTLIVNPHYQINNWKTYSNWGFIILGVITNIIVSISLAIFIGGIATSNSMGQGITMLIFFPSIFLTGIILPITTFGDSLNVINKIGYFLPFKYSVSVFLYGWWYHSPILPDGSLFFTLKQVGFNYWWEPLLGSLGYSAILLLISIKTFRWEIR